MTDRYFRVPATVIVDLNINGSMVQEPYSFETFSGVIYDSMVTKPGARVWSCGLIWEKLKKKPGELVKLSDDGGDASEWARVCLAADEPGAHLPGAVKRHVMAYVGAILNATVEEPKPEAAPAQV